jgi:hypothetical protein
MSTEAQGKILMALVFLLTIIFTVLKLVDVINWSWWLVLLPLWGWSILYLLLIIIALLTIALD